jgi:membrane protease YdiL (CAAX protease family)
LALGFCQVSANRLGAAAIAGVMLAVGAGVLLQFLPQGESEMTQILQKSSGMMGVLAVALVAPWTEELLLRGVVYGAVERVGGPALAILLTASVFSLLHLPQHAGNLGPWVVITTAGLLFSGIRYWTGSVVGSATAHMVYNLTLELPVFFMG